MSRHEFKIDRRQLLKLIGGLAGSHLITPALTYAADRTPIKKTIPTTKEVIPVIGLGTSRTFDSAGNLDSINNLKVVLEIFFQQGGSLIDSSPMYGSSEQVIGTLLKAMDTPKSLFAATKVWTDGKEHGVAQMALSKKLWGIQHFDLMQIHNLRDWRTHLETLKAMKAEGDIRYIGITTSHGRSHDELFNILSSHPFDFVQLSYNIANREAEKRLLPLARERGIAVIANRPFARGRLFKKTKGKALPDWVDEFGCNSWGQFFLKYAVSHPAITCAIPATSKAQHMIDNMGAGFGQLPDIEMRRKMDAAFNAL